MRCRVRTMTTSSSSPVSSQASPVRRFLGVLGGLVLLTSVLTALGAAWMVFGIGGSGDMRTAPGRVVAHETVQLKRSSGERSVVDFTAYDGRSFRVTDTLVRQGQAAHKVGESVTVRYPAADPAQAEIGGSSWVRMLAGWVLLVFSGPGMLAGWLLWRLRPRATVQP